MEVAKPQNGVVVPVFFGMIQKNMEQFILWFNILGFSLLFGSLGMTYIVYGRMETLWLKTYLLYLAAYAFFTIFNTYGFFSEVYLPAAPALLDTLLLYTTFLIALFLLVVVPWFVSTLAPVKLSPRQRALPVAMAGLFLLMMVFAVLKPEWRLDQVGSVFLNGYLGLLTLFGIIRTRSLRDRSSLGVVIPFLYLSCTFYFFVAVQTIVLPLVTPPLLARQINVLTAGLICFLWGSVTLVHLMVQPFPRENPVTAVPTEQFLARFAITTREREIIGLLLQGKSNKEIGADLFVSPRTVEAHVYNIYRKCSVKNKLELARKVSCLS